MPVTFQEFLKEIPLGFYQALAIFIFAHAAALGSLITWFFKFAVDYKIQTQDVAELKQIVKTLQKDCDAAHGKIRDLLGVEKRAG